MNYIFLAISTISVVSKNALFNNVGKQYCGEPEYLHRFYILMYLVCAAAFLSMALFGTVSLFTILLGIVFGVASYLSSTYMIKALGSGAMHITVLITTSSLLLPTVFGAIISNEALSISKLICILLLIGFIYLSKSKDTSGVFSKRWGVYCAIAFLSSGMIGILQKIHQTSVYKDEISAFLGCAFLCALILSVMTGKKAAVKIEKRGLISALLCGICIFLNNLINLKLSGSMPSQIFFPLANGAAVVLSSLVSIFFYKERITSRQMAGLIGGILSLIFICVL